MKARLVITNILLEERINIFYDYDKKILIMTGYTESAFILLSYNNYLGVRGSGKSILYQSVSS